MKKIVFMLAIVGTTMVSNAAYLFWQVSSTDYAASEALAASDRDRVAGASLWYTSTGDVADAVKVAENYYIDAGGSTLIGNEVEAPSSDMFAANLGDLTPSSYSYFVELHNSDGGTISRSVVTSYSSIPTKAWADTGSSTGSMIDIPSAASVVAWHAGGYRAVPEPTSGLMLLLGAAMLGLKRKNRSVA